MKKISNALALGLALSLALASFTANAADVCANLQGIWSGNGKVVFETLINAKEVKCVYHGVSTVTSPDVNSHIFMSTVDLSLLSGVCPLTGQMVLLGTCNKGYIEMIAADESASLYGKLNQNGKVGTLEGKVYLEIDGKLRKGNLEKTILVKDDN